MLRFYQSLENAGKLCDFFSIAYKFIFSKYFTCYVLRYKFRELILTSVKYWGFRTCEDLENTLSLFMFLNDSESTSGLITCIFSLHWAL